MQERRAEAEARREQRWVEFSEAEPELAAEITALRAEREAEREAQRAEFAAKYPNLAAAMEEGRFRRLMQAEAGRRGFGEERRRAPRAPHRDGFGGPRR